LNPGSGEYSGSSAESVVGKSTIGREPCLQLIAPYRRRSRARWPKLTQNQGLELRRARGFIDRFYKSLRLDLIAHDRVFDTLSRAIQAHTKITRDEMPKTRERMMEASRLSPRFQKKNIRTNAIRQASGQRIAIAPPAGAVNETHSRRRTVLCTQFQSRPRSSISARNFARRCSSRLM